jgi:hypothetical protein
VSVKPAPTCFGALEKLTAQHVVSMFNPLDELMQFCNARG